MNEYQLTFSGGGEPYIEEIYADLDPDAIELAEAAARTLCEGDWTEAVLLDNEGAEIWTTRRGDGQVQFNTLMVEVVPVARIGIDRFYMPDTNDGGRWKPVDLFAEQRRIASLDTDCNGNVRTLCQMLKVWKREATCRSRAFRSSCSSVNS